MVFILTDDQRWDQLGCEGHSLLKTPNLDRIAAEGARFANMFVTTSLCSPSRASFLSGRYAHSHGVVNNFTDYPVDLAPSVLEICGARPLEDIHGTSWKPLLSEGAAKWRRSWYYEYNYEKQFPYTPNVRGVRTDRWKYVHYPHGEGTPDRHKAELYDLKADPGETKNLIDDPSYAEKVAELQAELQRLMRQTGGLPDKMPLDEGVKSELPEESIR